MKKISELTVQKYKTALVKPAGGGTPVKKTVGYKEPLVVKSPETIYRILHGVVDVTLVKLLASFLAMPFRSASVEHVNGFYISFGVDIPFIMLFFVYYFICEMTFQSSVGKLISGSIVIDDYAQKPDAGTLLLRTLCRLIPFEWFSCFAERPWHDRLSNTYVVKREVRDHLQNLLNRDEKEELNEVLSKTQS